MPFALLRKSQPSSKQRYTNGKREDNTVDNYRFCILVHFAQFSLPAYSFCPTLGAVSERF